VAKSIVHRSGSARAPAVASRSQGRATVEKDATSSKAAPEAHSPEVSVVTRLEEKMPSPHRQ
jgi:hypothetical protein